MLPTIHTITQEEGVGPIRELFREYAASLGFSLCFQGFEQELADLPSPYSPPSGCLLPATMENEPAGCVALKPLAGGVCEMKRLYVRPPLRRTGLGRRLADEIILAAKHFGYTAIRLDTVPSVMQSAVALYRSLGFQEIPAYCVNPLCGAVFMELRLNEAA